MSERENEYSKIVRRNTDEELLNILKNHEAYLDETLQAVVWETENRNLQSPFLNTVLSQLEIYFKKKQEELKIEKSEEQEEQHPKASVLPVLYSQTTILAFSLFFSTLAGGILLAINASRISKKGILPIILFSVLFTVAQSIATYKVNDPNNILLIAIPISGAFILSQFFWNRFFGKNIQYQKRSVLVPLIIVLIIFIPMAYIAYKHPELLEFQNLSK